MNKIKILQFPIANSNGGITHYALNNWKFMDKDCFHCDFATMSKKIDFENEIIQTGSKIHYISCYAEDNKEQFRYEFEKILDERYDIVHLHTKQWKSFLVEQICKEKGVKKIIVHAHNAGIDTLDSKKRDLEIKLHEETKRNFTEKMATDYWACSKKAGEFLFGEQIDKKKIKVMPNAIELDKFAFNSEVRKEYRRANEMEDYFVIGHIGRFVYQKNHDFLINVFYELTKEVDNIKLVLLGDGELLPEVKRKVKELKLENDVLFLGHRDDIYNWYSAMDIFCLPSRFEGLPLSMIEAQASGVCCIASSEITEEVKICDNVSFLPLEQCKWKEKIMSLYSEYSLDENKREKTPEKLVNAGYNLRDQVKIIEKEYLGK
ncbi:MAG: glycosyltransferase [Lachnospiraceae bacterium]|nr:glycosyltransferase [Lachnospiraceae bacterium]